MLGFLAALFFAISFILHWSGGGKSPFDVLGFALLGLLCVALHTAWGWYPWRRP